MNSATKGITEPAVDSAHQVEHLLFFNYHEIPISTYRKLDIDETVQIHDRNLIVTHFPDHYASGNKTETRIVRLPRVFDNQGLSYPKFSSVLPGNEEGAITTDIDMEEEEDSTKLLRGEEDTTYTTNRRTFKIVGEVDNQYFGQDSVSPLSLYFEEREFSQLISDINDLLKSCYEYSSFSNILEFLVGLLTFWIWEDIFKSASKK